MNSIKYPFESSTSGDLVCVSGEDDIAFTRAYLLVDCKPDERPLIPGYGSTLALFVPDTFTNEVQAEILQKQLNVYCVTDQSTYEYVVTPRINYEVGTIDLAISIK